MLSVPRESLKNQDFSKTDDNMRLDTYIYYKPLFTFAAKNFSMAIW